MSKRAEILAKAVVSAWQHGVGDGWLLVALYQECGMTREAAIAEVETLLEMERQEQNVRAEC
jgi:hypothetical protein